MDTSLNSMLADIDAILELYGCGPVSNPKNVAYSGLVKHFTECHEAAFIVARIEPHIRKILEYPAPGILPAASLRYLLGMTGDPHPKSVEWARYRHATTMLSQAGWYTEIVWISKCARCWLHPRYLSSDTVVFLPKHDAEEGAMWVIPLANKALLRQYLLT
jgi:hypothetical protein